MPLGLHEHESGFSTVHIKVYKEGMFNNPPATPSVLSTWFGSCCFKAPSDWAGRKFAKSANAAFNVKVRRASFKLARRSPSERLSDLERTLTNFKVKNKKNTWRIIDWKSTSTLTCAHMLACPYRPRRPLICIFVCSSICFIWRWEIFSSITDSWWRLPSPPPPPSRRKPLHHISNDKWWPNKGGLG